MVAYYARKYSQDWVSNTFVQNREEVLEKLKTIPDTYWLMHALLDNMECAFFSG
jgi:hypothetical protein